MIKPVGSDELKPLFVYDSKQHDALKHEAETLPSMLLTSQAAANAVMMGSGYFSPLPGYMTVADAMGAAEKMTLTNGLFFPVPVMNMTTKDQVDGLKGAKRIALRDPNVEGNPVLAVMDVTAIEEVSDAQMATKTDKGYRTPPPEQPGGGSLTAHGRSRRQRP